MNRIFTIGGSATSEHRSGQRSSRWGSTTAGYVVLDADQVLSERASNSAPAVINMFYLPLSFCSGLWVPYMFLPKLVRQIALALPPYHLSQLALGIVGAGRHESAATHWEVLLAFTLICLGVARIGFQRDQGKLYG